MDTSVIQDIVNKCPSHFSFDEIHKKILKKHILEDEELFHFSLISKQSISCSNYFFPESYLVQEINENLSSSKKFNIVIDEILGMVDPVEGKINFHLHPSLKPIYQKITAIDSSLRDSLAHISNKWNKDGIVDQASHDIVDEHYIIPVRSDHYAGNLGSIIYRSKTGQTLYIEPREIRERVNEKRDLESLFQREKFKILTGYSEVFLQHEKLCSLFFKLLITSDRFIAHTSIATKFELSVPKFNKENHHNIFVKGAKHPLVPEAVENDINFQSSDNGILISGPNTGGKTVLLKLLALHLILPNFGLSVPSKQANIPLTRNLFFFSNDQQDILDGLSSFSSECTQYLKMYTEAPKNSFVFIDEIFNSTASHEASLISKALIDKLTKNNIYLFISSHHDKLKQDIFDDQTLLSAHMGFESFDRVPTYKFYAGTPGHSFALDIFKTIEQSILKVNDISSLVDQSGVNQNVEKKLHNINQLETNITLIEKENIKLKNQLIQEKKSLSGTLEIEREKLRSDFKNKWLKAKEEVFNLIEDIKKNRVTNQHKVTIKLNQIDPIKVIPKQAPAPVIESIDNGANVFSNSFKQTGKVIKKKKSQLYVQFKSLKAWVDVEDIRSVNNKVIAQQKTSIGSITKSVSLSHDFDARGMRRQEFLDEAEERIYTLINGEIPFLDIIHGHGDGILRKALYQMLNKFKELSYDHVEGNLGSTRVTLKKD